MNGSHLTIFIFHHSNRAQPMDDGFCAPKTGVNKKNLMLCTHCRATVHRCLAATPLWLLFESDRVKYRYSQCIYNSVFSTPSFVCFWLCIFWCEFVYFAVAAGPWIREVPCTRTHTHTLLRPMCIKNDLLSKCWRGCAGDYFDVRGIIEIYDCNAHWQTTHTFAHRIWMHNVHCCVRDAKCVFAYIWCMCVRALSPIQHLSIRPFVSDANAFSGRLDDSVFMNFIWKWLW